MKENEAFVYLENNQLYGSMSVHACALYRNVHTEYFLYKIKRFTPGLALEFASIVLLKNVPSLFSRKLRQLHG